MWRIFRIDITEIGAYLNGISVNRSVKENR